MLMERIKLIKLFYQFIIKKNLFHFSVLLEKSGISHSFSLNSGERKSENFFFL